ncbi:hypothetical protein K435DRAFT_811220 [Dendrothele bispora CBS 962.96]|uniref:Uncharacterized protein n=1 Tax=Dendrothele bispora (strain CBS 962.96) TaxID=1314807 RepID=A0A4S8KSP1_DENBC|nr:hypothetical protein K435DRAFT_811220 [Dendrothele bispora CBS 962.96]
MLAGEKEEEEEVDDKKEEKEQEQQEEVEREVVLTLIPTAVKGYSTDASNGMMQVRVCTIRSYISYRGRGWVGGCQEASYSRRRIISDGYCTASSKQSPAFLVPPLFG